MERKEKVVPCSSRITVYSHKTKTNKNMTVYEGVRKLIANDKKALELFRSNNVDVTVKLNPNGTVLGVTLTPNNPVSSSDSTSTEMETLPNIREDEKIEHNNESDDLGAWWRDESSSEEEDDLNLTLELESDDEADYMEKTELPDVIEATQLPPGKMTGVLKNAEPKIPMVGEAAEPDTAIPLEEEKGVVSSRSDKEEEPWMECWNCKAPKPIPGIYREGGDNIRMIFCCDKPSRIKPTNTAIECSAKSYPYDSWVNHSYS